MLLALSIILFILALADLAWMAEVQTTIAFVLDKGGLWLEYSTGIGRLRLNGFQIRMMEGHNPRAWMRRPLSRKLHPVDFQKTIAEMIEKKRKPIHLTLGSKLDIGIDMIIRELSVNARIGIEDDAAATALLCGSIATALHVVRAMSTRGEFIPIGYVVIKPIFDRPRLSVRFKCILAIKARHIIQEVIKSKIRRKKHG